MKHRCNYTRLEPIEKGIPNPRNPNTHPEGQIELLAKIIDFQGWRSPIVVSKSSGFIVRGHGRLLAAQRLKLKKVPIDVQVYDNEAQEWADLVADNRIAELAEMDRATLKDLIEELDTGELDLDLTGFDEASLEDLMSEFFVPEEGNTDEDEIPEEVEARTKPGDLWQLGDHRLLCGDCTKAEDVEKVTGGGEVCLVHADPPYGMGKEKDGIANDNLYREKLDAFQMEWWRAVRPRLEDNASAYIWGNAPDLWRLWFLGGLNESERMTHRSQIIWDKPPSASAWGSPIGSDKMRSFPHGYETCLFVMLGEQGFNNNADNYWEGWEPIRAYLDGERKKAGFSNAQCNEICGKQNMTQAAFTRGGFRLITEEDYNKLQKASKGKAFKRAYDSIKQEHDGLKEEHDGLKQEFYKTRAFFDNTHDNMTDVWDFPRVTGEERFGHATPKPVAMIERVFSSSSPKGSKILVPFGGTFPEVIAAQRLERICYGIEIDPHYCDVAIQRWEDFTGKKARKVEK